MTNDDTGCSCGKYDESTSTRKSKYPMLEVSDALQLVLQQLSTDLPTTTLPIAQCLHHIVASDIVNQLSIPAVPTSTMDGYAVCSSRTPAHKDYTVVSSSLAGGGDAATQETLHDGELVYITTGAPLPPETNAVIPVEMTSIVQPTEDEHKTESFSKQRIHLHQTVAAGTNVRPVGSDLQPGTVLLQRGDRVGASEIGLLASTGHKTAEVYAQPTVGVLSSGNELIDLTLDKTDTTQAPPTGSIFDSNRPMLLAACQEQHVKTVDLGIAGDEKSAALNKLAAAASQCDILLTSGGVSMGEFDLIKPLLEELGTVHFGRINMKPGKPLTFATVDRQRLLASSKQQAARSPTVDVKQPLYVFALPGNPVSALVCFQLFVIPAIKVLQGHNVLQPKQINSTNHGAVWLDNVTTNTALRRDVSRPEYQRVQLAYNTTSKHFEAQSTGKQQSSRLLSTKAANALLYVECGTRDVQAGEKCKVMLTGQLATTDDASPSQQPVSTTHSHKHTASQHQHQSHTHATGHYQHSHGASAVTTTTATTAAQAPQADKLRIRVAVLTMSDRCSQGQAVDKSGPAIVERLNAANDTLKSATYDVTHTQILPDDRQLIARNLSELANAASPPHIILTTGGTGFSPRDVTPEATRDVIERTANGIEIAMMHESLKHTPMALLSRAAAGTFKQTIIVNMPGSPKAVAELMPVLTHTLPHAVKLLVHGQDAH